MNNRSEYNINPHMYSTKDCEQRYKRGSMFILEGEEYILCTVNVFDWCLIGLESGNRFVNPVTLKFKSVYDGIKYGITKSQLSDVSGGSL